MPMSGLRVSFFLLPSHQLCLRLITLMFFIIDINIISKYFWIFHDLEQKMGILQDGTINGFKFFP